MSLNRVKLENELSGSAQAGQTRGTEKTNPACPLVPPSILADARHSMGKLDIINRGTTRQTLHRC